MAIVGAREKKKEKLAEGRNERRREDVVDAQTEATAEAVGEKDARAMMRQREKGERQRSSRRRRGRSRRRVNKIFRKPGAPGRSVVDAGVSAPSGGWEPTRGVVDDDDDGGGG